MAEPSRIRDLIHGYLDGLSAEDELRALAALVASDPRAADELAAAAELDSLLERRFREERQRREVEELLDSKTLGAGTLGMAAGTSVPQDDGSAASPEELPPMRSGMPFRDGSRAGVPRRVGRVVRTATCVVAVCVVVGVGGLAWRFGRDRSAQDRHVLSGEVLVAGRPANFVPEGASVVVTGAGPAVVEMADGSQAEFAPTSAVVVHGRRGPVREVVELVQGAGLFRVEKGSRRFRVETAAGNVTALGTEFSVELRPTEPRGEDDMGSVRTGLLALAVAVVAGAVEVELQSETVVLAAGDSRVFAAADDQAAAQPEKKVKVGPPAWGDVAGGFRRDPKSGVSDKTFPGLVAALLLTDEQKLKFQAAREATVGSEAVRNAGATLKTNPNATEEEKAKARETMKAAQEDLQKRAADILTEEQRKLVEKLEQLATESQQAARQALQAEAADVKKDPVKAQEFERRLRERTVTEFDSRAATILSADRLAAVAQAAQERKAAEERAKNNPKKK